MAAGLTMLGKTKHQLLKRSEEMSTIYKVKIDVHSISFLP